MKVRTLFFATALFAGARLTAADAVSITSNFVFAVAPQVLVEGRHAKTADGTVRLGFPGVALHLCCHGGSLAMRLNASSDEVYFDVQVDGNEPVRLRCHKGEGEYSLLENQSVADHLVEITRRSESWQGVCEIIGFKLGHSAQLLPPPALLERKLMFIGDSITCGEAADIRPRDPLAGHSSHNEQNSNARLSFGKILARRLHAQCHLVSYGGRGVLRDWQGSMAVRNAPQFYELALPDDPSLSWNAADYVPDEIVICLGTNDFSSGVPDENQFVKTYVDFVRRIRRDSPRAKIFLAESPILQDSAGKPPKRTVLRAYLLEVLNKIHSPDVSLAPVSHYAGVPHNGHPSGADHVAIAKEIEPLLRQAMGWN